MGVAGGPVFRLRTDPLPDLTPAVEEAAFRIVAECLTNVARHADAGHCEVDLARENGHLRIAVSDDGRGIASDPGAGHGLASMRRRAADLGGTVTVDPGIHRGTTVRALLPLGGI
jgi:signal transduction histidine kinase